MISRREVVTAGMLGTLSTAAAPAAAGAEQQTPESQALVVGFSNLKSQMEELSRLVSQGLVANSLTVGVVGTVKSRIEQYLRTSGKFPEFCDIGTGAFFEIYGWHVKHQQQIQITRLADQRLMIQFMFTQLILRWENDASYIGQPYDK
ncbi:MAG: hypothetical protein WC815_13440 [Vicinamibacterales bacterium]|jgi:hypothetical protein